MEQLLVYFAIGGCTGWLLGWAMGRDAPRVIKYIIFGGIGGLAGGFLFIVANGTKDWAVDREKKYVRL